MDKQATELPSVYTKYCGQDPAKLLVRLSNIHVDPDRARKEFEDIHGLAQSIWDFGLLAPLVIEPLTDRPGHYRLIAGERRFRAHVLLMGQHGITHAHCNLFDVLSPVQRKRLELEENLRRKQFEPFEEIEGLRQLHEAQQAEHGLTAPGMKGPGWKQEDTARMVGQTQGAVSTKIKLATKLKERQDIKLRVQHLPINAAIKEVEMIERREKLQGMQDRGVLQTSSTFILGGALEELKKLESNSIDLCIIDPPFGISNIEDMSGKSGLGGQSYTGIVKEDDNLSFDASISLLEQVLPQISRVLKPSAHLYIFHANQQRSALLNILSKTDIQHLPDQLLIWNKVKTTTPFMGKKFMSVYEPILFCSKLPSERRLASPEKTIIECNPQRDTIHVFQKPHDLLCKLIKLSSNLGDTVLDCFAGSGSTCKAAASLGRSYIGIEKNKEHWLLAQQWLGQSQEVKP